MKKNLFLGMSLLAIAGLWAGCSNDEGVDISPQGKAISFGVQGGVPEVKTKATATTTEYVNAFVVSGSDDKFGMGDPGGTGNDVTGALFRNFSIARSANATSPYGYYDYNPKRYFSKNATSAKFFAYSPVSQHLYYSKEDADKIGGSNAAEARPGADAYNLIKNPEGGEQVTFYYTVPMLSYDKGETTQEDLLVAWENVDNLATTGATSKVQLNFVHALSRVFITAQNKTTSPVRITNLQFNNLYRAGTVVISETTKDRGGMVSDGGTGTIPDDMSTFIKWTGDDDTRVKDNYNSGDRTVVGEYRYALPASGVALKASAVQGEVGDGPILLVSKEQGMMVIPQKLISPSTDDLLLNRPEEVDEGNPVIFSLRVDYELSNLTQTDYIALPAAVTNFEFKPGQQYLINIVFTGREINFEIAVAGFGAPEYVNWEPDPAISSVDKDKYGNIDWDQNTPAWN